MKHIRKKLIVTLLVVLLSTLGLVLAASSAPAQLFNKTWFLAEGSTAETAEGTFETYIEILNTMIFDTEVKITYNTPAGEIAGPEFIVEGPSIATVNVADTVPNEWSVSAVVEVVSPNEGQITVEREMYWITGDIDADFPFRQAAHSSLGANMPSLSWFLAEGSTGSDSTGSFETWVLVQNPLDNDATVDVNFQTPEGTVAGPQDFNLPAGNRHSFDVSEYVPDQWSVSTSIESDQPIVAERSMYWDSSVERRIAATCSKGLNDTSETWYLAEGSTGLSTQPENQSGNFETWVLVANPGDTEATVDIAYQTPGGAVQGPQDFSIPAGSRHTFDVADTVPNEWDVSAAVDSDVPVAVERAMYWNNPDVKRKAAHDSIGTDATSDNWQVPGGRTDGGFESWILVQNPNGEPVRIAIDYFTSEGVVPGGTIDTLPANSRKSYRVNDIVEGMDAVGSEVQVTGEVPHLGVIVEHAIYWSVGQGENYGSFRNCALETITFPTNPVK